MNDREIQGPIPSPPTAEEITAYYREHPELWVSREAYLASNQHAEPSLFRKATNLAGAIVTHAAAGFPATDAVIVERRWSICRACDKFDAEHTRCRVCGCRMQIKISWDDQRCPIGKW